MPLHSAPAAATKDTTSSNSVDPFTRKSSVKKVIKGPKKQQGSSRFRSKPCVEIQPLTLLKGNLFVVVLQTKPCNFL